MALSRAPTRTGLNSILVDGIDREDTRPRHSGWSRASSYRDLHRSAHAYHRAYTYPHDHINVSLLSRDSPHVKMSGDEFTLPVTQMYRDGVAVTHCGEERRGYDGH